MELAGILKTLGSDVSLIIRRDKVSVCPFAKRVIALTVCVHQKGVSYF